MKKLLWDILPKKSVSRISGKLARHSMSKKLIPFYIRLYNIDLTPVKKDVNEFNSLLDFFVRELDPAERPIHEDAVVSPVDGTIVEIGTIDKGTLIQAKGIQYSLASLLGNDEKYIKAFNGGKFVTLYLSPRDYHRIHMPVEGEVSQLLYIPGQLYPVNKMGLENIPGLFARNERIISYVESNVGHVAVIKVGATNVGSIKVNYDPLISSNKKRCKELEQKAYNPGMPLAKGEELGRFEFGSTVILLFEPDRIEWTIDPKAGTYVQMGQSIAKRIT